MRFRPKPQQFHSERLEPRRLLSFVAAATAFDTGVGPSGMAVGDLNGDGLTDLAVASQGYYTHPVDKGSVSVHLGNGDGTFQPARHLAAGVSPFAMAMEDFNGDGRRDLFVASSSGRNMLLGNGDGTFQAMPYRLFRTVPDSLAAGDYNRDGRLDLAVVGNGLSVLLGNGDGTFRAPWEPNFGFHSSVAAADFNGDGRLDLAGALILPGGSNSVGVSLGNGDGTFHMWRAVPAGWTSSSAGRSFAYVAVGEFNRDNIDRDGRFDLIVVSYSVRVLLGSGDGTFRTTHQSYVAAGAPTSVVLADFNGDNSLDAATANLDSNNVSILLNDGDWPAGPRASVAGRHVFYNNSTFDGNDPAANAQDAAAVAPDKVALRPGGTASVANYTNFSKGITGVMVDVLNPPTGRAVSGDDFTFRAGNDGNPAGWAEAPQPTITVTRGGAGGSDRVTLTWPDSAVKASWLQVTVLATADTGLETPDVFYFGNLPGDTFNGATAAGAFTVNSLDLQRTRVNQFQHATISSPFDHDRSGGVINSLDLQLARINQFSSLPIFTAPAAARSAAGRSAVRPVVLFQPAIPITYDRRPKEQQEVDVLPAPR